MGFRDQYWRYDFSLVMLPQWVLEPLSITCTWKFSNQPREAKVNTLTVGSAKVESRGDSSAESNEFSPVLLMNT